MQWPGPWGTRSTWRRIGPWLLGLTALLAFACLAMVLGSGADPANTWATYYLTLTWVAIGVVLLLMVGAVLVRRIDLDFGPWLPTVIGLVSVAASLVPWLLLSFGQPDAAAGFYREMRVPQGEVPFWDLVLPLRSIECASAGFDVYAAGNGCLEDPTIYGPGVLWLRFIPWIFAADHVGFIGVLVVLGSSLLLAWLARRSTGAGQVVLLVAALGAPWLLLLERGNVDALVLVGAGLAVVLTGRWDRIWSWAVAAGVIWLLGTWKYYPFAMGLMLLPVLRLRRGWMVLAGYAIACAGFLLATWDVFRFSSQSNSAMVDFGEVVVLGRVTLVARMAGSVVGQPGLQFGDALVLALAVVAVAWGACIGLGIRRVPVSASMLAVAGSSLFLVSVVVAGFGWGYKATFLLLGVPLASLLVLARQRAVLAAGLVTLAFIGVDAVVVSNMALATVAGVIAAGFLFGCALAVLVRSLRRERTGNPRAAFTSHASQGAA